ncbi:FAD-dependent oxidoreductase [Candidatus Formimonas warabiya]|uniref:(2Fe-2S)-binding protein n=1 Tax=Formimonas warabiya TaxID=1761012 RepID=A0A3G1KMG6_FORW1|nr:FAD-dependent oxidoreductase [Candidatus Formimonas warabiya]ATW23627.1 (2Fe-2S)-binding protein [Candidatus Formimonas warabiya]
MNMDEQKRFTKPPQSYWMASTPQPGYPVLNEDLKVDIAIIGGGFSGIACGYMLIKEGIKTCILEADHILQGTTGHTTAKITSQHGLIYSKIKSQISAEFAQQYADANESAIKLIEKIAQENHIACDYIHQSAYVYTLQDKYVKKISEEANVASSIGIKASYLEEIPLPIPVKAAVRFDHQAQFHPRKFLLALAREVAHRGSQIFEQTRIVDMEEKDQHYLLTTHQGKRVSAKKVIIASHYPCYNKNGLYFARLSSERSYVVAIQAKEKYPGGMYITAENPARSLRNQAFPGGELIIVGGEHHKTGQGKDTIQHYQALIDFANETFNVEDIPYRWSTQDCMTLDDLPYIGHFTSDTPNLYIATGYGKWGMTNSMVSAMIIKDLIVHGENPWQDVYNPSRQTIIASAKNFLVENLNVAEQLIDGKISSLPTEVTLKPGEGKIIEANGQRAGAYKDEQGTLHVVDTTCTHMGCELNWNSAEKSWDCPCHGSRFSYEGNVIEGPAVRPLNIHHDVNTIEKLLKDNF